MDDLLKRIDTQALYPPFLAKLRALLAACVARGAYYVATSGLRTYEQQDALYAKGRTAPGGKVTNAKGGKSLHNFAIAVDFAPDADPNKPGLQPDYDAKNYVVLGEEAEKLGLEWGGNWTSIKDTPHIQLPYNKKHGIKLSDLDQEYRKGGYPAVFAYLDKFTW